MNNQLASHKKSFSWIFVVLFLIASGLAGWLYYQNLQLKKTVSTSSPAPSASPQITPNPSSWKTAKHGGLFSYEYPSGWHVAELWQDNYAQNGVVLAIDPNPINTAPRGGPIATFTITLLNGNKNPDEILQQRMADFNSENYSDINQETINANVGAVYYYKGKMAGPMLEGEPVESYFFTFHKNPNDLINQQVVIATMALKKDPQLSEMLRHIVLSFKEISK